MVVNGKTVGKNSKVKKICPDSRRQSAAARFWSGDPFTPLAAATQEADVLLEGRKPVSPVWKEACSSSSGTVVLCQAKKNRHRANGVANRSTGMRKVILPSVWRLLCVKSPCGSIIL